MLREKRNGGVCLGAVGGCLLHAAGTYALSVGQAWPCSLGALNSKIPGERGSGWVLIPLTSLFPQSIGVFIHKAKMMSDRSYSSVKTVLQGSFNKIQQSMCWCQRGTT